MNPALPLLAGLSLAGWGLRRWRAAVLACGLAGVALLAGALRLPDGIPSPGADLARRAPWTASVEAIQGNVAQQDVTFQVYPWLLYLRQEVRAGRWPFWNPHQFSGMTFWGNGQSAPLSPFHVLFVLLPLRLGFVVLPWAKVVCGGLGVFLLLRELGSSEAAATAAALVYPLSGMLVSFLLFPMGSALALVPWVFLAVERLATGSGGWPALGLAVGLQGLCGHPETSLHTALLCALYLALRGTGAGTAARTWLRFAAGWLAGGLVAAAALAPLAVAVAASSRWQEAAELAGPEPAWRTLVSLPARLVLPDMFGNPARGTWWGPFNYLASAVYAGALALPFAALGAAGARRDRRRMAWLVVLFFAAAGAYRLPGVRQGLEALPLLGSALHHRLLFGVELGLAVLAGLGVDAWREGRGRAGLWGVGLGCGLAAIAVAMYRGDWHAHDALSAQTSALVLAAALWGLFASSLLLRPATRVRWTMALLVVLAGDLILAHRALNPAQRLRDLYPSTGAVEFLRGREGRVAATGEVLRPNAAMVYGLDDVRGDDPLKPLRYERLLAQAGAHHAAYFAPLARWDAGWLDRLAVRWVMTAPGEAAPDSGWRAAYDGADARVFERGGDAVWVRWSTGEHGSLRVVQRAPGWWEIAVEAREAGRVIVSEGWDAGWRAAVGGERRRVEPADALLAVDVPAGSSRLRLTYEPAGLRWGAAGTVLGLALLLLGRRFAP